MKMHRLAWKPAESSKEMEKEMEEIEDKQLVFNAIADIDSLQPSSLLPSITRHTGSCLSPDAHSCNPHSSSCTYGIQTLINNVHRGYINFDEDDDPDQNTITKESSQPQESQILRSLLFLFYLQLIVCKPQ